MAEALAPARMPPWPHEGPVDLIERDPQSGREARFVVDRWRLVSPAGTVADFDREAFRVLRPYVEGRKRKSQVVLGLLRAAA